MESSIEGYSVGEPPAASELHWQGPAYRCSQNQLLTTIVDAIAATTVLGTAPRSP